MLATNAMQLKQSVAWRKRRDRFVVRKGVHLKEVLFEFHRVGQTTRVVAIDPITMTEITMVGAKGYSELALKRLAIRKLTYVIAKKQREQEKKS
jgi:hypothetical protein